MQMMSKAFMNGEVKKDSLNANTNQNKDTKSVAGRWNVKKESSPSGLKTTNSGNTTPTMARWKVNTEKSEEKGQLSSHAGEKKSVSGSTTPTMGRWKVNTEKNEDKGKLSSHIKEEKPLSGSTTPVMGRWNDKKEASHLSNNTSASINQSPQEIRRMHLKTDHTSTDAKQKDSMFTSKASIGNISVKSRTTSSPITQVNNKDSIKATNTPAKSVVKDTGDAVKVEKVTAQSGTNDMEKKEPACDSPKLGASKDGKGTRFAMRKQKRAKRHRSDGYMLALEMAANSSEDEGFQNDPSLGDAINFLQWIRNPSLQNLAKLRRAIKTNDKDWMKEFLEFDGLGLLFQCLKDLSAIQGFHLTDMVLKMECIMCIREVVNSQTGLDCLLQIKGRKDNIFGRRFASGMYKN